MNHISNVLFNASLDAMKNVSRVEKKIILTESYERGIITGEQLEHALRYCRLESP